MTGAQPGEGRARLDPAQMQLLVTGVREALDDVARLRAVPRFRHTADPSLFARDGSTTQAPPD